MRFESTTTGTFGGLRLAASDSASPSVGSYGAISYTGSTSNYFYAGTNLPRFDYYNKGSFVASSTSNSYFQSQNLNVDFNQNWTVSIWFKHKNPDWDFLMDYAQGGGGTLLTAYSDRLRWNYGAWFTDSVTDSPTEYKWFDAVVK